MLHYYKMKTVDGLDPTGGGSISQIAQGGYVLAGPVGMSSGIATFRKLQPSDLPPAGTPGFSGLTTNGAMYAVNPTTIGSTGTGTGLQVLTSNGANNAPTFRSIDLSQAGVIGTLTTQKGGLGGNYNSIQEASSAIAGFMGGSGAATIGNNLSPTYTQTRTDINTLKTKSDQYGTDINQLKTDTQNNKTQIDQNTASIDGLTTEVDGLGTQVEANSTALEAQSGLVTAAQATADGAAAAAASAGATATSAYALAGLADVAAIAAGISAGSAASTANGAQSGVDTINGKIGTPTGTGNMVRDTGATIKTATLQSPTITTPTFSAPLSVANGGTGISATSQNFAFLGPLSGSGAPTWRAVTSADIPAVGTPTFSGLTPFGVAYATSSTNIITTPAGTQYQSMVANATGAAPTFQAISLAQAAATTGILPVISGGSGTATATGTGNNVLSAGPTFTGAITAATASFTTATAPTYALQANSTAASGDTVLVTSTSTTGQASLLIQNGTTLAFGQTGSASTGTIGTSQSYIQPSANGLKIVGAVAATSLALTTPLPVTSGGSGLASTSQGFVFAGPTSGAGPPTWRALTSGDVGGVTPVTQGGTGVTTSTGSGNVVLSNAPTFTSAIFTGALTGSSATLSSALSAAALSLTGPLTVNSGTSRPLAITTSYSGDPVLLTSSNTTNQSSVGLVNDTAKGLYIGVGSSGNAGIPNQPYINTSANGLKIPTNVSVGAGATNAPTSSFYVGGNQTIVSPGTALTATSNAATGNTVFINAPSTTEQASIIFTANSSTVLNIGQSSTSNAGSVGTDQSYIIPSAKGLKVLGPVNMTALSATSGAFTGVVTGAGATLTAALSGTTAAFTGLISGTTLALTGAFTGTSVTLTGLLSGVAATLTGTLTGVAAVFSGAVSIATNSAARPLSILTAFIGDTYTVRCTAASGMSSVAFYDEGITTGLYIGMGCSTNAQNPKQGYIGSPANGIKMPQNLAVGSNAVNNPSYPLQVNASKTGDVVSVTNAASNGYGSGAYFNDVGSSLYMGVGGSAVGGALQNAAYITGSTGLIMSNPTITFTTQPVHQSFMHTVITNWQSTGNVYQISSGSYVAYPIGAIGSYFFGPSGTVNSFGNLAPTGVAAGGGVTPYWAMPVSGIYTVKWRWTPSPFYNSAVISKNMGDGTEFNANQKGNVNVLACHSGYYYGGSGNQPPAGLELTSTYYATTSDKIYLGQYEGNFAQNTAQPQTNGDTSWNLTFTLIQRTG